MSASGSRLRSSLSLHLQRFGRCERGATAIEYTLICVVMAIAITASFQLLKEPLTTLAQDIADAMKPE